MKSYSIHLPILETKAPSFSQRVYRHLESALKASTEVTLKLTWGSLTGVPTDLDESAVELVYLYVSGAEDELEDEDICWRTVWLIKLEDVCALSYSSEGWSKERFNQVLQEAAPSCPLPREQ